MASNYKLEIKGELPGEIAHHYESQGGDSIFSTANRFTVKRSQRTIQFEIPIHSANKALSYSRILRRALRLDKSNAVFNHRGDGVVILYGGVIYFYDLAADRLTRTGRLRQCRNVLHCGIAVTERGIYFGEYGHNTQREAVPVWRSCDDGRSWSIVYEFPPGSIKHIHGIYSDPYSPSLWIPTGDFAGECTVAEAKDPDFKTCIRHGDGTQKWRPVSMFFEPDSILWPMDSPLETSYLQQFDRQTQTITQHRPFPGPIWYSKRFTDGIGILQSSVEPGVGVTSDHAHLFASKNLIDWTEVTKFQKDWWPMKYFKFGVIAFAGGNQTSDDFVIFGEALKGLDGRILRVGLTAV
ncbi:MAG: hypothetical protein ABL901_09625 [Hyphomicrobiaceae bacterium]